MGTFGYTTPGDTTVAVSTDKKGGSKFTLSEDGAVTKISVFFLATTSLHAKCGIYSDNAGAPNALLGTSQEVSVTPETAWRDFTFTVPVALVAGVYWLVVITDGWIWIYKDAGDANQYAWKDDTYSDGFSNPFGVPGAYYAYKASIYATYTSGTWTLTITAGAHGDTDPVAGVYPGAPNREVVITSDADAGYSLFCWLKDGVNIGSADPYTITMDTDHTVQPVFLPAALYGVIGDCDGAVTWATPGHNGDVLYFGLLFNKFDVSDIESEIAYFNGLGTDENYNGATVMSRIARVRGISTSTLVAAEKVTMTGFTWFAAKHWPNNWAYGGYGDHCLFSYHGLSIHYYLSKKLGYDPSEFNNAFAWQEFKAILVGAGKGVLWGNPITLAYYSDNRFYDENALSINVLLELYKLDPDTNAAALTYALLLWDYINTTHWSVDHYNYRPDWTGFECEGSLFPQVIMKLYAANGYTLTNSDRLLTDVHTRFLASGWDSPQWMFTTTKYYAVVHHHTANSQRRLNNTFGAWITLHAFYQAMVTADQTAIVALLNSATKAWQYLIGSSGLFDAATHKFKLTSSSSTTDSATAIGIGTLFLLGIVPDTGSLYVPLIHNAYEDIYTLNSYFMFDYTNRTIRIPVKAGDLKFIYGATALTVTFDEDGVYELTFSPDWTMLGSKTKIRDLDTRLLYSVRPTLTGLAGGSKLTTTLGNAIRKNGEDVTHRILFLDDMVDADTGWYVKDFVEETIYMWLIEKNDRVSQHTAGVWALLDAVGLTQEDVWDGDEIEDSRGKTWFVVSKKDHIAKGDFQFREVQMTQMLIAT